MPFSSGIGLGRKVAGANSYTWTWAPGLAEGLSEVTTGTATGANPNAAASNALDALKPLIAGLGTKVIQFEISVISQT